MNKKTIKNILGMLLIGALGSGIWSLLGEPTLNWFINIFIEISQFVNHEYYNSLHENIGKGFYEADDLFFRTLFRSVGLITYIVFPFIYYIYSIKEKEKEKEKELFIIRNKKLNLLVIVLFSFYATYYYISSIIISNYNKSALVFVERSIEILSPDLKRKEILQLRSDYRSIDDAEKFYELHGKMDDLSKKYSINLPEFEVAR